MTKKDFEFFAQFVVYNDLSDGAEAELIRYFAQKNPRFDHKIWRSKIEKLQAQRREILYGN